jgi:hypothetical protein
MCCCILAFWDVVVAICVSWRVGCFAVVCSFDFVSGMARLSGYASEFGELNSAFLSGRFGRECG